MPVILARHAYEEWRAPGTGDAGRLLERLVPYDADTTQPYPVSPQVNWPSNDTPDVIAPIAS